MKVLPSEESPSPGFQTLAVELTPMKNLNLEFLEFFSSTGESSAFPLCMHQ